MVPENTTEKKQKPLKQKETKKKKGNLHAKRNQKKKKRKQAFLKFEEIHTLICQNVHTITSSQNFHTYIQILQNSN